MENRINIAELLKDCPKGIEFDCTIYDGIVKFDGFNKNNPYAIRISVMYDGEVEIHSLTKYGQTSVSPYNKCVIFPKGKTTWEGFVPPCRFKDGDIIADNHKNIAIYKGKMWYNCNLADFYCGYRNYDDRFLEKPKKDGHFGSIEELHLATEEEKQKLFDVIKENGYKWNEETKTLEKLVEPKFKVGDKIVQKNSACTTILITNVGDEFYYSNTESSVGVLPISEQDDWELVSNKFDINTLVPFESKVLIRDGNTDKWKPNFWGFYNSDIANNYPYECCGDAYQQCIPYEGNEHLLGTTNDCDEYYKTWK